jgi:hypothetical protein
MSPNCWGRNSNQLKGRRRMPGQDKTPRVQGHESGLLKNWGNKDTDM